MVQESDKVTAIIVTYNSTSTLESLLQVLTLQVAQTIIVDNNSQPSTLKTITALEQKYPTLSVIYNTSNKGLAKAQNQGIEQALTEGSHWILLLDDDSLPDSHMVYHLLKSIENTPSNVVIVTPQTIEKETLTKHKVVYKGGVTGLKVGTITQPTSLYIALSSGMLIRADHLRSVGYMKEKLFIDEVDTEFCLRTLCNGKEIQAIPQAILYHTIGTSEQHAIGIKKVTTWNHSPKRKYYIFRNRVWLWRNYALKVPRFVLYEIGSTLRLLLLILLFEKNRIAKVKAILKGVWEGLWL